MVVIVDLLVLSYRCHIPGAKKLSELLVQYIHKYIFGVLFVRHQIFKPLGIFKNIMSHPLGQEYVEDLMEVYTVYKRIKTSCQVRNTF